MSRQKIDFLKVGASYLSSVNRIRAFGIWMGATKAWRLAAVDPRIKLGVDLRRMADFEELIKTSNLKGYGIYYYAPILPKHFSTAQISKLIVPGAYLSQNGRKNFLTPQAGVESPWQRFLRKCAIYYDKLRDVWPDDVRKSFDEGLFDNPHPPYYYEPKSDL